MFVWTGWDYIGISIHSPRMREDAGDGTDGAFIIISIHSPRMREDRRC